MCKALAKWNRIAGKLGEPSGQQNDSTDELNVDWFILTPIIKGYCTMTEIKSGVYTLYEFLDLHEAIIDIQNEEKRRAEDIEMRSKT